MMNRWKTPFRVTFSGLAHLIYNKQTAEDVAGNWLMIRYLHPMVLNTATNPVSKPAIYQ
jgi:hypothetical protein